MRKRIPADERRQELVKVAERLFATRPYADISVQEIADEAGVARGLIHHYFGGKDDILAAVIRELTPRRAPRAADVSLPIQERVEQRVDMLLDTLEQHSQGWLATLASGPNIPPGPLREATDALLEAQYQVWLRSYPDVVAENPRTRALFYAYRGLNQATCRMWLNGELERSDARAILVSAQTAMLTDVGPTFD